ncbi:hypothetical protein P8452_40591 [Trifolium repens]|nr:hypothetical protein P8452_40591 [Trifolium repens]
MVQRHESQSGKHSDQEEGSSIGGLAIPRNAGKPTKDGILGTASAPIRTEPPLLVSFIVYAVGALIIAILKGPRHILESHMTKDLKAEMFDVIMLM